MQYYVYHHDDPDGHVAGAIAAEYITNCGNGLYTFSKDYTDSFVEHTVIPTTDSIGLWFVDLSFTDATLSKLMKAITDSRVKSVVWIDHHASSKSAVDMILNMLKTNDPAISHIESFITIFDTKCCGALLTYLWCSGYPFEYRLMTRMKTLPVITMKEKDLALVELSIDGIKYNYLVTHIPEFLQHLDAYDRWTGEDPSANAFIAGFKVMGYNLENNANNTYGVNDEGMDGLYNKVNDIISDGNIALEYQRNQYLEEANYIKRINYHGLKIAIKNGHGNSWNFNKLLTDNVVDFAILFKYDGKSNKWVHSIYGNKNGKILVNKIAEKFGGGGHPGAAGFSLDQPIFSYDARKLDQFLADNFPDALSTFKLIGNEKE